MVLIFFSHCISIGQCWLRLLGELPNKVSASSVAPTPNLIITLIPFRTTVQLRDPFNLVLALTFLKPFHDFSFILQDLAYRLASSLPLTPSFSFPEFCFLGTFFLLIWVMTTHPHSGRQSFRSTSLITHGGDKWIPPPICSLSTLNLLYPVITLCCNLTIFYLCPPVIQCKLYKMSRDVLLTTLYQSLS